MSEVRDNFWTLMKSEHASTVRKNPRLSNGTFFENVNKIYRPIGSVPALISAYCVLAPRRNIRKYQYASSERIDTRAKFQRIFSKQITGRVCSEEFQSHVLRQVYQIMTALVREAISKEKLDSLNVSEILFPNGSKWRDELQQLRWNFMKISIFNAPRWFHDEVLSSTTGFSSSQQSARKMWLELLPNVKLFSMKDGHECSCRAFYHGNLIAQNCG